MNRFTIGVLVTVAAASAVFSSGIPGTSSATDAATTKSDPKAGQPVQNHGALSPERLASAHG